MTFDTDTVKVSETQKALSAYIKKETGKGIKPETIAVIDALREAYRKDPARVAEREQQKAAARARKQAAYQKALEKARKLAADLGVSPGDVVSTVIAEQPVETLNEDNPMAEPDDDWAEEDEPVPSSFVEKPKAAPRKRAAAKKPVALVAVPTPADDPDTSAIEVKEAEDGWETSEAGDGDDFYDDDEAEDY